MKTVKSYINVPNIKCPDSANKGTQQRSHYAWQWTPVSREKLRDEKAFDIFITYCNQRFARTSMEKIIIHFVRIAIQLVKIFHESLPHVNGASEHFKPISIAARRTTCGIFTKWRRSGWKNMRNDQLSPLSSVKKFTWKTEQFYFREEKVIGQRL